MTILGDPLFGTTRHLNTCGETRGVEAYTAKALAPAFVGETQENLDQPCARHFSIVTGRSTSGASLDINRYLRLFCFQDLPDLLLQPELKGLGADGLQKFLEGKFQP